MPAVHKLNCSTTVLELDNFWKNLKSYNSTSELSLENFATLSITSMENTLNALQNQAARQDYNTREV